MYSIIFIVLALLFGIVSSVEAYTCTINTCLVTLSYNEPTTYVSGAPLTNLQDTVLTYQLDNGANQTLTTPASKPQGGGAISVPVASQIVPQCQVKVLTGSLVVRTAGGGISSPLVITPLPIDRTKLASGAPDPSCTTPNPGSNVTFQ